MVGSANENYRSMLLDGEAMVLVSGWTSLYAVPDLILLTGIATWIDEKAELDRRLPPVGGIAGALGRALRMGL
jgi:phosphatidylserine/phosphatidylglycerophosphate/cardiolipin synthase-like enzyme